ncbi:hypothetical protein FJU08_16080 [Martelella alba]|uniref:Uncharacterized protein n=1 Tax=Martelella alba TaxID=2590451 RepID=A0A506U661_9HYPH|nr:hypothetical protein [Martelella alba]TPW28846.1 hypothetical protein FJU08_16080 [Martelella alba]
MNNVKNEINIDIFPEYMNLVKNIFYFDIIDTTKINKRFPTNAEMIDAMTELSLHVDSSDLDEDLKAELLELIDQERDVIAFSEISRNSVVAI